MKAYKTSIVPHAISAAVRVRLRRRREFSWIPTNVRSTHGRTFHMYRCIADLMRNGSRYHSHAKNPIQMLSFGVGLTKTLGALIEQQGPAGPFVWPRGLSPYRAIVIVRETHPSLDTLRVDQRVLVDDRPISVGRRIKEAEWFGVPYLAVAHHDGIELVDRVAGRTVHRIAIEEFFTRIQ